MLAYLGLKDNIIEASLFRRFWNLNDEVIIQQGVNPVHMTGQSLLQFAYVFDALVGLGIGTNKLHKFLCVFQIQMSLHFRSIHHSLIGFNSIGKFIRILLIPVEQGRKS